MKERERKRGRRHEGWIKDRKGIQYACLRYKGEQFIESSASTRVGDAQRLLERMRREVRAGTYVRPRDRAKETGATLEKVAKRWLDTRVAAARNEKGRATAKARVDRYLLPGLGAKKPVASIMTDDLRAYRLWLEAYRDEAKHKLAVQTVAHVLGDARNLLIWAEEERIIARSPFPKKLLPKPQELAPKALTPEEAAKVAALADPCGLACRVMLGTGVRWGELVALQATDVQDGALQVAAPKTKKLRRVPIPPALLQELRAHVGKLVPFESNYVASFDRMVRRLAGIEGFGAHQCRHTFATRWLEQGGNLGALQVALGHASITTTMRYAKPSEALLRDEAARLWAAQAREA